MSITYDYVVVGSGFSGATFAHMCKKAGKKVLVIEKKEHLGGNCHTELVGGIMVHKYGPHIFHTNDRLVWDFVNQFSSFASYRHSVKTWYKGKLYDVPISFNTLNQLWGTVTPKACMERWQEDIDKTRRSLEHEDIAKYPDQLDSVDGWCLWNIGKELYDIVVKGYTWKQWGRHPMFVPASVVKRLPIHKSYTQGYFTDRFQGIPHVGYTSIIESMLEGIDIERETDFLADREILSSMGKKVIYTGMPDALYNFEFGPLPYRSLAFVERLHQVEDVQGMAQLNWAEYGVPQTRTIEHKHFMPSFFGINHHSIVTTEYPQDYIAGQNDPFYPINNRENNVLFDQYKKRADEEGIVLLGRLGQYSYLDMAPAIKNAMNVADRELKQS